MIRGQFPAPWHNLNVSSMEDNILKRAAAELKEAGCRVFALIIEVGVRVII